MTTTIVLTENRPTIVFAECISRHTFRLKLCSGQVLLLAPIGPQNAHDQKTFKLSYSTDSLFFSVVYPNVLYGASLSLKEIEITSYYSPLFN